MGKKGAIILAAAVVVVVAILLVWHLSGREEPSPEPPPAQEDPAVAEDADETPGPAAETEVDIADAVPDILEELGETDDIGSALLPMAERKEPESLDPRCREILEGMKEQLGWDRIETMKCTMKCTMKMEGGQLGTMEVETTIETVPGQASTKTHSVFEAKALGQTVKEYQISDGVFMETGMISPDGKRSPIKFGDYDPSQGRRLDSSPFSGALLNSEALDFDEALDIKADPNERMFQKEDGSAIDNLDLVQLTARKDKQTFELFVDPETMKMVGMRLYVGDSLLMEMSQLKYEQIAEGVLYPIAYHIHTDSAAAGAAQARKIDMKLEMSDIVVNEPVDPATFHFTANPTK